LLNSRRKDQRETYGSFDPDSGRVSRVWVSETPLETPATGEGWERGHTFHTHPFGHCWPFLPSPADVANLAQCGGSETVITPVGVWVMQVEDSGGASTQVSDWFECNKREFGYTRRMSDAAMSHRVHRDCMAHPTDETIATVIRGLKACGVVAWFAHPGSAVVLPA
jgi:hypothetical protein